MLPWRGSQEQAWPRLGLRLPMRPGFVQILPDKIGFKVTELVDQGFELKETVPAIVDGSVAKRIRCSTGAY